MLMNSLPGEIVEISKKQLTIYFSQDNSTVKMSKQKFKKALAGGNVVFH